jgi:hypothetical protein
VIRTSRWWNALNIGLALLITSVGLVAQGRSSAQASETPPDLVPLKVDVVITRNRDNKAISRLPFTLWVNANERGPGASIRMGMSVPVPTRTGTATSVSYRNIGTNIDCSASSAPGGAFELTLIISDSSVYDQVSGTGAASVTMSGYPAFRSFDSSNRVIVRDGQTVEYTMATDKLSGEVLKVSVTATVVK